MADQNLSQLTDEQLGVYRDLLAKKQAPTIPGTEKTGLPPVPKPMAPQAMAGATPPPSFNIPQPNTFQKLQSAAQEHPYLTAASSLLPTSPLTEAVAPGTSAEVGKGALKTAGRDIYEGLRLAGPIGMAAHAAGDKFGLSDALQRRTEPSNPAQEVGKYATMGAEMALPMPKALDFLPSAERAGRNFELVHSAARDTPVDLMGASVPALRAQELTRAGSTAPKVMNDFLNRIPAHNSEPMLFPEARDFQASAGRLSASDKMAINPPMAAQVSGLAKALSEANQSAADSAGVGKLYGDAMNEYRQAMKLKDFKENATDIAKQIAKKALIYGPGVGLGDYAAHKIINGVAK